MDEISRHFFSKIKHVDEKFAGGKFIEEITEKRECKENSSKNFEIILKKFGKVRNNFGKILRRFCNYFGEILDKLGILILKI